jgi:hypothetical protein
LRLLRLILFLELYPSFQKNFVLTSCEKEPFHPMTKKNIDLTEMPLPDVIAQMVADSGKHRDDIAAEVGWSSSVSSRIFNPSESYWPSLPTVPRFCVACGSTLLIDWLVAQVEIGAVELEPDELDWVGLLLGLTEMEKELGDVAKEVRRAIDPKGAQGRDLSRTEAKRIIREVQDVITRGVDLIKGLRHTAGNPGKE